MFSIISIGIYNPYFIDSLEHKYNIIKLSSKKNPTESDSKIYYNFYNRMKNKIHYPVSQLDRLNIINSWRFFKPRKKITVAVIDTPINKIYSNIRQLASINLNLSNITNHHGEHVAHIIKAVNPKANIISIPFFSKNNNNIKNSNIALKKAIDLNVDIINYSAGGNTLDKEELFLLKKAKKKGIVVVVASGNDSCETQTNRYSPCRFYPALHSKNLSNTIAVSSLNLNNSIANSSNFGTAISDISAYGVEIPSLYNGKVKKLSGTSQATAFVTGIISLALSHNTRINSKNIKKHLCSSSTKDRKLSKINRCGGIINSEKLLKSF